MTTIVTRASKGGRLSFTEMDNNLINLKNTADAAAPSANPTFTGTVSGVTASMVGLGNVNNTSDANKPVSTAQAAAIAVETSRAQAAEALLAPQATTYTKTETDAKIQAVVGAAPAALTTAVSLKAPLASPTFTGTVSGVTAAMVGLGNVNNTSDLAKPVSTATTTAIGVETTRATAAEGTLTTNLNAEISRAQAAEALLAPKASPTFTGTVSGVTAAMVGLGNVTNVAQLPNTQTLAHTGDVTSAATALNTGTVALTLANSGVTAGTYKSVTVDAKGRVTSGTNPTTLSGYGITDAAPLASPSFTGAVTVGSIATTSSVQATVATVTQTAIDTWAVATYRSAKYVVQITQGSSYQVSEILVVQNGTTTFNTEFASLMTGSSLATFDTSIVSGNVNLLVTMAAATSANINIQKVTIAV